VAGTAFRRPLLPRRGHAEPGGRAVQKVKAHSTPGVTLTNEAVAKSSQVDVAVKDSAATQKSKLA